MTTPLLVRFVSEARDLLQAAATCLLRLEKSPDDEAAINEVFRAVHTLKGSVGLFDFPAFTKLVHAGEDLLSAVRAGQLALSSELVDLLLDALDQVSAWVDSIDAIGALPDGADGVSRDITARLRTALPQDLEAGAAVVPLRAEILSSIEWLPAVPAAERLAALRAALSGADILALEYLPAEDCFFSGEDPAALFRQVPGLLALAMEPRRDWPAAEALDPYCCLLRFRALTTASRAEIEHLFRYVIEQVALTAVAPHLLAVAETGLSPAVASILDGQRVILELPAGDDLPSRLTSVARTVENVLHAAGQETTDWREAVRATETSGDTAPLLAVLARLLDARPEVKVDAAAKGLAAAEGSVLSSPDLRHASRVLKVDQAKIDSLMNLIGELVVSKNSLPFLARRAEEVYGSREMSREIKDLFAVVDRLAQEMQAAIMAVRMLPVSEVFERFPRLVRDIARKLGKRIDLVIEGEDTAADKTIVEMLGDPLLHIIRNALDHGIETPDEREAQGKPVEARVLLKAFQEGDQVVIEVSDDGRGIDPVKIRAAAVAKGVIDAERAAGLTDQDAVNLVFLPGFSTAGQVSDLSGRGVGMDVVVSTVEKANGSVSLSSVKGEGTTVRLSLPLSMAVTRVMMVEAGGGMLFGIPMDHIAETVRIPRDSIRHIKQSEAFVLRDTIVPLLRLDTLLGLERNVWFGDPTEEDAVLVVRIGNTLTGLVVDHFREGMDIILKPFDGILAGLPNYSGTALLGDGRVLLVLNLKELL
ncbi:chemotaxis protein CheA [Magnetospirillum fulvum]|uniref:Chemotaxis protein CheA n=1 Tax=Magnetospirillum fulvum TaxID=1082 RepID=A0A1H6GTW7_MAGFU|nr:chemotaxis protein CheA [Magnetospirillum fulvum]SEH25590.1 two-component system, chemotaxis family, sensor kinase CheA [Magnetospirillum fulvum]